MQTAHSEDQKVTAKEFTQQEKNPAEDHSFDAGNK
jgi:hypothetical protein